MPSEIRVPTLGESITEATVGKWYKKPGDAVKADEPVVELETDKVTLEVNAPSAGVIAEITAAEGDTVGVGALLGSIGEGSGAAAATSSPGPAKTETKPAPQSSGVQKNEQPAAQATGGGSMAEIRVPTLGESISEATVGKWFKKAGDTVKADEALVELETDKVTLEVNAPAAGVLASIVAEEGSTVGVGALLGAVNESGAGAGASQSAPATQAQASTNLRPPRRRRATEEGVPPHRHADQ
jgi:2-oxoglutarate dehydrogenase E2 component (dihydrolipoamide succinyltransferase)